MSASRPGSGVLAAAGLIGAITLVARLVGFARWLEFSRSVGASCVGTTYQTANILPNVLFELVAGGALAAVAVPLVAEALARSRSADADQITSAMLTWSVVLLGPVSALLVVVAEPVARLFLRDGACPGSAELAAYLLRVFALQVPLYGVAIVLAGTLQAHRRFLGPALAPLLSSLVVIGAYAGYGRLVGGAPTALDAPGLGIAVLGWGTTLGVVVLSLPLLVPTWRSGITLRPTLGFPPGVAARVRSLAAAGVVALLGQQVVVLATVVVANRLGVGVLNVYTYVQALYLLPYAVLALPLATAAFPALAGMEPSGAVPGGVRVDVTGTGPFPGVLTDGQALEVLARTLRLVVLLGAMGAGVLAAVARPLGGFFGALDAARGSATGREVLGGLPVAVLAYAPGLVGFSVAALLTRALYVRGRPARAARAMALGWLIAGILPLVLVPAGTDPGVGLVVLGLSSSLGMTVAAVVMLAAVGRAWGQGIFAGLARTGGTALAAASVAAAGGLLVTGAWRVAGLGDSALQGLLVALLALSVGVAVIRLGDPATVRAATSRAMVRRQGGAW